jgi:hypothetical protein
MQRILLKASLLYDDNSPTSLIDKPVASQICYRDMLQGCRSIQSYAS